MFNIKIAGSSYVPKFDILISDFPDAEKIQDQIVQDDGRIRQFAIYKHPDFKRLDLMYYESNIDFVWAYNGKIIGPAFNELKCVKDLCDTLLAL